MGTLEFGPISAAAATGFGNHTRGLINAIRDLTVAGDIRPIPHFDDVMDLYARILGALDEHAADARRRGRTTIEVIEVPMSGSEWRQLRDVGLAIESYVELLATRGLLDLDMDQDEADAMAALVDARHSG